VKLRVHRMLLAAALATGVGGALVALPGTAQAADCTATRTGTNSASARCLSTPVRVHALCFVHFNPPALLDAYGPRVPAGSTSTVYCPFGSTLAFWGAVPG